MCQAIPRKVLQVGEGRVEVLYDGQSRWVMVQGLAGLTAGEYVVVHAGQAMERMPTDEAEDILRFYEDLEKMLEEASR